MHIQTNPIQKYCFCNRYESVPSLRYQYNLNKDTVSFGAIKKSGLDSYQLLCANYFKPPLEKFNKNEDLRQWARTQLSEIMQSGTYPCYNEFEGTDNADSREREKRLLSWQDYLLNDDYMKEHPTLAVYIADSITKDLYPDTKNFPPIYDKDAMNSVISQMDKILAQNPKAEINFKKNYHNQLRNKVLHCAEIIPDKTREHGSFWVRIPSMLSDPNNIEQNLKTMNVLSAECWCTKGYFAQKYLKKGDFYIYMESGKPELSVRLEGNEIKEVRDRNHDCKIPLRYYKPLSSLIQDKGFDGYQLELGELEHRKSLADFAKNILEDDIRNKNYTNILRSAGIEVTVLDDGMLELSKFAPPSKDYTYQDLGVSENEMFRHIKFIKGNADFRGTQVTNLGALKEIGGYTFAGGSKLNSFGKVKFNSRVFWD